MSAIPAVQVISGLVMPSSVQNMALRKERCKEAHSLFLIGRGVPLKHAEQINTACPLL
jgi:hypothetical protein